MSTQPTTDAESDGEQPATKSDEVDPAASIRDRAEQLHAEVHQSDRFTATTFGCWSARALLRLTELEADRLPKDAPDHEHDAYSHQWAATMASAARSDVVTDVETGRLLTGKTTPHELVADHQQAAHWVREETRREQ
ncbi:hypothetical protein [Natronococcus jeotgali]|uniref:Uncharacterized protein n=1 Tax=Natronococcus jeotgali DSM 18795 TaxID=1227498 RepID=L9XLI7_9EURY|nr:hypothetical protein [Natronococcus jeotgali]ELY62600.1 hypothetical protein C492_07665 [Natronococcus jeotgali DSM 18795]